MLANATLQERSVDLQALGLWAFLMSLPDDWIIDPRQIGRDRNISAATVYRIMNRLIRAGFVHRELVRGRDSEKRIVSTQAYYLVFESQDARREFVEKPVSHRCNNGSQLAVVPCSENPARKTYKVPRYSTEEESYKQRGLEESLDNGARGNSVGDPEKKAAWGSA